MTTVGDAIKAALDANWAGSGGTEPALYSSEDVGKEWPTDPDWIKVLGWTYRRRRKRRNDTFIGERYLIDLLVHSMNDANSEERLDTIVTEIYRIITPTNVTGFHDVDIVDESRAASDDYMHFMATLTVELTIKSTSAAVTPGSGGDGDVAFPADVSVAGDATVAGTLGVTGVLTTTTDTTVGGDLTVTGNDIKSSGGTTAITLSANDVIIADKLTTAGNLQVNGNDILVYGSFRAAGSAGQDTMAMVNAPTDFDAGIMLRENNGNKLYFYNDASANKTMMWNYGSSEYLYLLDAGGAGYSGAFSVAGVTTFSDESITSTQIADLLMFGSANAAYVPLALWGHKLFSYARSSFGYVENIGADDINMDLVLTQPCTKGSLKLYISNLKFGVKDSDAADYITTVRIHGINENDAVVQMDIDTTNHTTAGDKTFSGAVMPASAMDCSGYQTIIISVACTNSAVAAEMDIGNFRMECYYAA